MTINDVASDAGVSLSTVSRVLNDNKKVNPELRDKVLESVKKLGYKPNNAARSLASSKTNTIGVIVNNLHDTFFCDLIKGFEYGAREVGFNVLYASILGSNAKSKQQYLDYFANGIVDGIVLYGSHITDDELIDRIKNTNVKFATIENDPGVDNCFKLLIDNYHGTEDGVIYLANKGFRKLYFICGNPLRKVMIDRQNGFFSGIKKRDLDINDCKVDYVPGDTSGAYDIVNKIIDEKRLPDAFFCADDALASYTINALTDRGVRVPDDVSVLGFDNRSILPAQYRGPSITTIEQPLFNIGKDSIQLLSSYLTGATDKFETKIYQTRIVEKESVFKKD